MALLMIIEVKKLVFSVNLKNY